MSRLLCMILSLSVFSIIYADYISQREKPRILVSTDIGGTDPDDNQSMIHMLMYANEFDIEGIVSSPSFGEGSKEEILRMIDLYAMDLKALSDGLAAEYGTNRGSFPTPDYLASVTRQGAKGRAPHCGFREATEGSELIVNCARKIDHRPLWILVWGTLDDLAQALHDAPDIVDRIRVYWIGGPNKKWGCNAYSYIAENFPSLWFIENNATYRGFIESSSDTSIYGIRFHDSFIKSAGNMGKDFSNYYKGSVKMGDSPSLLYLMGGDAENPHTEHWGGSFEPVDLLSRYVITGPVCERDTLACYSLLEWVLDGPRTDIPEDSICFTLSIDHQQWPGYYIGDGKYVVRYSPKAPATLPYSITSDLDGFSDHNGCITVGLKWPGIGEYTTVSSTITSKPLGVGKNWFTDTQDYSLSWQGAGSILRHRKEIMRDWGKRFGWLLGVAECAGDSALINVNEATWSPNTRLIVTTDLGGSDPDDIQSMIHLLVCSDRIDIEGLVSSEAWVDDPDKTDKLRQTVEDFIEVLPTLSIHSSGYPTAEYLRSVVVQGQDEPHMDGVGEGKDSPGSDLIVDAIKKDDGRPIWIAAWGGMNTVAQALYKLKTTNDDNTFRKYISRIRIYDILGQDDAGAYIAKNYPDLLYIRNKEVYGWAPDDKWTQDNIQSHLPLGAHYPNRIWATEGDSPSFLYVYSNGLNDPEHPGYGGWGGRFNNDKVKNMRGMDFIERSGKSEAVFDDYYMIGSAPEGIQSIKRWEKAIHNDFAARMIWSQESNYGKANHHPVAAFNGDMSRKSVYLSAMPGEIITLSASGSYDPDNDALEYLWSVYEETSDYDGDIILDGSDMRDCKIIIPERVGDNGIHIILEVSDNGTPKLTSYRRIIIKDSK